MSQCRLVGSSPNVFGREILGSLDREKTLTVALHLRPQKPLPIPDVSPVMMSRRDLAADHGASTKAEAAVKRFAKEHGLELVAWDRSARLAELSGSVEQVEQALGLRLVRVRSDVEEHRSHHGHVHLPGYLEPYVQGVLGLDDRRALRSHARAASAIPGSLKAFMPPQLGELYEFPNNGGEGQAVAIIELGGGYRPEDLKTYFNALHLPLPKVSDVFVNGGANRPGGAADTEVYLDIEVLGALAPEAEINVYFSPGDNYSFIKSIKQAVHDPVRKNHVLSVSWGAPELLWQGMEIQAMNEALHEAALLGVTVCVSSGDQGASGQSSRQDGYAHTVFPASSPYALACGGTRTVVGPAGAVENVWNDDTGASGGGVSSLFQVPSYQSSVGVVPRSVNPGHWVGRGVPDVAANADQKTGYVLWKEGSWLVVGGTSAAAPLWAALVARLNQTLGRPQGFLNPRLYQAGAAATFADVIAGNNSNAAKVGGYTAGPGWDACTGWGSPRGETLAQVLASSS